MPYSGNVKYFGGEQQYADAIKQRESTGGKITDPAGAAAFKAANPGLFATSAATGGATTAPAGQGGAVGAPWGESVETHFDIGSPGWSFGDSAPYLGGGGGATTWAANQAGPQPQYPDLNLSYNMRNVLSEEEAARRAQGVLGPQYDLLAMETAKKFGDERKRLPYYLNARGQLYGGLRAGGEARLTQEEAQTTDKQKLTAQAELAKLAQAFRQEDEQSAISEADRNYQMQRDLMNATLNRYETEMTHWQNKETTAAKTLQGLIERQSRLEEARIAAGQDEARLAWDREQAYLPWTEGPTPKDLLPYTNPTANALLPYQGLTALQQSNVGGGGTGAGGTKAPTKAELNAEASKYLTTNITKFKRPIDLVEQARRNYEAGQISKHTYDYIKGYLESNYSPTQTFEHWKK